MKNSYIAALLTVILIITQISMPSFGSELFANPILINSTDTQAVFQYETSVAGTIYYTVTPIDSSALTADTIKTNAINGTTSKTIIANGIVTTSANIPGELTVTGLDGEAYTLYSTFETDGALGTVNARNFMALKYEEAPSVTQYFSDKFIVKSKFNQTGEIFYAVYKDATGITAADVVNGVVDSNLIFIESKVIPNGLRTTLKLTGLKAAQTYDLVFARKDGYGNINQNIEVINDVSTKGNALINVVYQNAATNHANLYFNEAINNVGTNDNYVIRFLNASGSVVHTCTTSEFSINTGLSSGKLVVLDFASGFPASSYIETGGKLEVQVLNGNGFDPSVVTESDTVTYTFSTTALVVSSYPMMMNAIYQNVSPDGPEGDFIAIELNSALTTSPAAVNFKVTVGETLESETLVLTADSDYTISIHEDLKGFDVMLTSAGAVKLKDLPTSYIKVAFNSENPPNLDASASSIYTIRNSSVSTLTTLSLYNEPISGFNSTVYSYTVTKPYIVLQAYNMTPASAMNAQPSSQESYLEYQSNSSNVSTIQVYAADGTKSEYTVTTVSNDLTIGGIAINNVAVDNFDPYSTNLTYTVSQVLTTAPELTVTHLPTVTETTTYVVSGSNPSAYVYTVVLSKDGDEAVYTITVTGASGTGSPTTPTDPTTPTTPTDPTTPTTPTDPTTPTTPTDPTTPTTPTDPTTPTNPTDPTAPTDSADTDNPADTVTTGEAADANKLPGASNEKETTETLSRTINNLKLVDLNVTSNQTQKAEKIQAVTAAVTELETKINSITSPEEQFALIEQLMLELKAFKAGVDVPTPAIDKSVQDMVQNTADNYGTVKIYALGEGNVVKIDNASLTKVIDQQTAGLVKLNEMQQSYFEETVARKISKTVKFEVSSPENQSVLRVENTPEQIKLLKEAQVESFAVSNVKAEIKMPLLNLSQTDKVQFVMEKQAPPAKGVEPDVSTPEVIYEITVYVNEAEVDKFNKPVTLTFDLENFNLQNESPLDLAIFKLNVTTGIWEPQGGIVDPESGKIFVKRDNLSQYTVLKSKKSFSDSDQSWAKAEINAMLNKGIVADSGNFDPQSVLTRGEFAQWIAKAYGLKVSDKGIPFKDVAKTGETHDAIAAVYQQGLLTGKSSTSFDPNAALTQNEMAAALGKLLVSFDNKEKTGKVTSKYLSQMKTTQVASWAEDDMALLMELGMNVTEKNGQNPITKEAAAAAFMKFYRS